MFTLFGGVLVPDVSLDRLLRPANVLAFAVWAVKRPLLVGALVELAQLAVCELLAARLAVQLVALQMDVVPPRLGQHVPVVLERLAALGTDGDPPRLLHLVKAVVHQVVNVPVARGQHAGKLLQDSVEQSG